MPSSCIIVSLHNILQSEVVQEFVIYHFWFDGVICNLLMVFETELSKYFIFYGKVQYMTLGIIITNPVGVD